METLVGSHLRTLAAEAGALPVLLLVPVHLGTDERRPVLDLLPAAENQADLARRAAELPCGFREVRRIFWWGACSIRGG